MVARAASSRSLEASTGCAKIRCNPETVAAAEYSFYQSLASLGQVSRVRITQIIVAAAPESALVPAATHFLNIAVVNRVPFAGSGSIYRREGSYEPLRGRLGKKRQAKTGSLGCQPGGCKFASSSGSQTNLTSKFFAILVNTERQNVREMANSCEKASLTSVNTGGLMRPELTVRAGETMMR
jgi:hypothetical protein